VTGGISRRKRPEPRGRVRLERRLPDPLLDFGTTLIDLADLQLVLSYPVRHQRRCAHGWARIGLYLTNDTRRYHA
jgi:hypothetical protein